MRTFQFRGDGASNDCGVVRTADFSNFSSHIFGTFGDKANIVMQPHEMLYRLSSDLKTLDIE